MPLQLKKLKQKSSLPKTAIAPLGVHTFTQLIDTNEVVRMVGMHCAVNARVFDTGKSALTLEQYIGTCIACLDTGASLTGTCRKLPDGSLVKTPIGKGSVEVRSLWLRSTRDIGGHYWRAARISGYKAVPFPHNRHSRLVQEVLKDYLAKSGRKELGIVGAEYGDVAHVAVKAAHSATEGPILVLSTSASNLQLVRHHGSQRPVHKFCLRDNVGNRFMDATTAYGWLENKTSGNKRKFFTDLEWAKFVLDPGPFFARWDYVRIYGVREGNRRLKEVGGVLDDIAPAYMSYSASETLSDNPVSNQAVQDNLVSDFELCLQNSPVLQPGQLDVLRGTLHSSGLRPPIAPFHMSAKCGLHR